MWLQRWRGYAQKFENEKDETEMAESEGGDNGRKKESWGGKVGKGPSKRDALTRFVRSFDPYLPLPVVNLSGHYIPDLTFGRGL